MALCVVCREEKASEITMTQRQAPKTPLFNFGVVHNSRQSAILQFSTYHSSLPQVKAL